MKLARLVLFTVLVACASRQESLARSPAQSPASSPAPTQEFAAERALLEQSATARQASDFKTARAKAAAAVTALLARSESERNAAWLELLDAAGSSAWRVKDAQDAHAAWQRVFDVRLRTLHDDDPKLQDARLNLAVTFEALGELEQALPLEQKVVEVRERTLPDEHPDLQSARQNLGATLREMGRVLEAYALERKVVDMRTRTLSDDDPLLQDSRMNLAATTYLLGRLEEARALAQKVLDVRTHTLSDDDPRLQDARQTLAITIEALGDLEGSRALEQKAVDVLTRTRPPDDPDLQRARGNLATTIGVLGDLEGERSLLEKVVAVFTRTLAHDNLDLQRARGDLAATLYAQGDLEGARALFESVLEIRSRKLPDDNPELQMARLNLAATIGLLGDVEAERALEEKVLEVRTKALPPDHPELQEARMNLAATLGLLGQHQRERALEEQVLEVYSRTLSPDHPDLQELRGNLAHTLGTLGDHEGERALEEQVLEVYARTMPDEHPELQTIRAQLARTLLTLELLAQGTTGAEANALREQRNARVTALVRDLCRAQTKAARKVLLTCASREAEERCAALGKSLGLILSVTAGQRHVAPVRELEPDAFALAEATRGAALAAAAAERRAAGSPRCLELRNELRRASAELAELAQQGTTSETFTHARTKRETLERELMTAALELSAGRASGLEFDASALAGALKERDAAIGFRRYARLEIGLVAGPDPQAKPTACEQAVESLCAFVVRPGTAAAPLTLVDLGPIEPIEAAVDGWRKAIGVGLERGHAAGSAGLDLVHQHGDELRKLVLDPLLPALAGAEHLVVALDGALNLVPLEELPLAEAAGQLGDRWRIETRDTLTELLLEAPAPGGKMLVALGGVSFNVPPAATGAPDVAVVEATATVHSAELQRRAGWERNFTPLTHTAEEARGIGALYTEVFGDEQPVIVLEKRQASREALEDLAARARFVHIATHGWFAPESIRSWSDAEPLDKKSGLGMRLSGVEQVRGMSPMLLCGLAFAGANLPENALGHVPGLVTADELSTLDLSNCELAVLSACDTNVGTLSRAGQGIASLQRALRMAGARSVITSLWKVPDEATKELMLDFYRRLWVAKQPKWQALWEAKRKLREAKDEAGRPKYTTMDWAAWVLTGNPD